MQRPEDWRSRALLIDQRDEHFPDFRIVAWKRRTNNCDVVAHVAPCGIRNDSICLDDPKSGERRKMLDVLRVDFHPQTNRGRCDLTVGPIDTM